MHPMISRPDKPLCCASYRQTADADDTPRPQAEDGAAPRSTASTKVLRGGRQARPERSFVNHEKRPLMRPNKALIRLDKFLSVAHQRKRSEIEDEPETSASVARKASMAC